MHRQVEEEIVTIVKRRSSLFESVKNLKQGAISYKKVDMPDDMVKLTLFMLVN